MHVSGQLELLSRDGYGLIHLGQHPVVPGARELLVHCLQGYLLPLGFGKAGIQPPQLVLQVLQVLLILPGQGQGLAGHRITVGQTLCQLFLQFREPATGFHPLPAQQDQGQGSDDNGRT